MKRFSIYFLENGRENFIYSSTDKKDCQAMKEKFQADADKRSLKVIYKMKVENGE